MEKLLREMKMTKHDFSILQPKLRRVSLHIQKRVIGYWKVRSILGCIYIYRFVIDNLAPEEGHFARTVKKNCQCITAGPNFLVLSLFLSHITFSR